ncbi:hypothetical protein PGTUg99_031851 [Puccinia graminis f. sp. tritici]|uniref:RING-type domain-containing protein n=1 Tax=Puccinia graminis f. sp. tritici TaxID=56615 RepID=A0A5B0Q916_PUCGR|nr:hypothetical protein PGTUg99_031851 [Puccinia graminis f. sp. tritici]
MQKNLEALEPLPPQTRQLFETQFAILEAVLIELARNRLRNGLDEDQYEQFLGPPPSEINEAFGNMDEDVKAPLRFIYGFWRSWTRHVHNVRCASFAASQKLQRRLASLTISNAVASADGEALKCLVCQDDLSQVDQPILQLPCHPTHIFHRDCIQPWLESHSTCPTCRATIELPPRPDPSS